MSKLKPPVDFLLKYLDYGLEVDIKEHFDVPREWRVEQLPMYQDVRDSLNAAVEGGWLPDWLAGKSRFPLVLVPLIADDSLYGEVVSRYEKGEIFIEGLAEMAKRGTLRPPVNELVAKLIKGEIKQTRKRGPKHKVPDWVHGCAALYDLSRRRETSHKSDSALKGELADDWKITTRYLEMLLLAVRDAPEDMKKFVEK
jgi:hypothetical protein